MYRLLVVDNEFLIRLGIKETISWNEYNIEIVGEASDGQKAYQMIKNLKPDIIITDIKLPIISGIEIIKKLKEDNYDGTVVVLSGHRDFEYAKCAFENGAFSYVLKPIDNQELVNVCLKAIDDLEQRRKNVRMYKIIEEITPYIKSQLVYSLLIGDKDLEKINKELNDFDFGDFSKGYVVIGKIDNPLSEELEELSFLKNKISEKLKSKCSVHVLDYSFEHSFALIIPSSEIVLIDKIINNVLSEFENEYSDFVSIGVSPLFNDISEIADSYKKAEQVLEQKLFTSLNTVIYYDKTFKKYKKSVVEALEIISKRYNENLSVKIVADELLVSESYLMHVLKESLGKTFNDLLTGYRLMIAKKLILSGKYRINQVADLVGYSDVKYFSQVFRKYVGMTPSEFLEKH